MSKSAHIFLTQFIDFTRIPDFQGIFHFSQSRKHFYGKIRSYSESARETASDDVRHKTFSSKKSFLEKMRVRVPLRYLSVKIFFFKKCFIFLKVVLWVIYDYFWAKEACFRAQKLHVRLLKPKMPTVCFYSNIVFVVYFHKFSR